MNLKRYSRLTVLVFAVSLLAACNNSYGILSSIQGESKNTNTSKFYQTTVRNLVSYKGRYYAQLVGIYSRPAASSAGSDWTYLENADLGSDYVCRGMATTSAGLFVAVSDGRGSTSTPNGIFMYDGSSWSQIYKGTETIQALYSANDQIFTVTMDSTSDSGSTYSLKHLNGSTLEATDIAAVTTMPTNVVYFNTSYWCASGTTLYSGTTTSMSAAAGNPAVTVTCLATDSVGGSVPSAIFIGSSTGYVYRSTDGSSWEGPKAATSGTSYAVTTMLAVPTATGRSLIVGNSLSGYYVADVSSSLGDFTVGSSSSLAASASVYESSLGNMPVVSFVYMGSATDGTLFACASATSVDYTGLWSNKWTTTGAGWVSE